MAPIIFFSYTHVDENYRNQLEIQLASLKRLGLISAWHDRRITAGSHVDNTISSKLQAAQVILLLVSPDFIASDYCYEREMKLALERHEAGEARVIPIIVRPCDWHDLPFGKLLATPRDGRPITLWSNQDEAFLDVVKAIKAALKEVRPDNTSRPTQSFPSAAAVKAERDRVVREALGGVQSSNLRIRKEFSELDVDRFREDGFDYIAHFFENSLDALVKQNSGSQLEKRFRRVSSDHFAAALYKGGNKICKGSATLSRGGFGRNAIEYVMSDNAHPGTMNEAVYVKNDGQELYFEALGLQSFSRGKQKLSAHGAAELFWDIFIAPLR